MSDQITTPADAAKLQVDSAIRADSPLVAPAEASNAVRCIDLLSFLFLLLFQCACVFAIVLYTPQIGEMGFVVFGIIFVWLGATLFVGLGDLLTRYQSRGWQ